MTPQIHPNFKLNGHTLDYHGVMTVAYSYIKEGEEWEKQVGDFLLNWLDDYDVVTVFTSGSTGSPKQYKLHKQHMINSALMTGSFFNLDACAAVLCCLPLSYIAGKMMFVRALTLGWELDIVQPSSNPLKDVNIRYDFTAMTIMQASNSINYLYKVRNILLGGSAVSSGLIDQFKNLHTSIYHSYGMTETSSHIAIKQLYPVLDDYYTALPQVRLTQDNRKCLVVNAPKLCVDTIVTNDVVDLVNERQFKVIGRVDDVINSGGIKLHPSQIEKKLSTLIKQRFFITGINDNKLGEKVILIVEGKTISPEQLNVIYNQLDTYEVPKHVYFVDKFELTHTQKIDKRMILEKIFR